MWRRALAFGWLWLVLAAGASAQGGVQPVPALTARVMDTTGTLAPDPKAQLEAKLAALEAAQGSQVVVLVVGSTQPEDIAAYAQRVADAWKIGRRTVGDGVLVVVAKDDRRVRIEVAKALEGAIPDLAASRIVEETLKPAFRAGDFAGGLSQAVDRLAGLVRGEALPPPEPVPPPRAAPRVGAWQELALFLFAAVPALGAVLRRVLGRGVGTLAAAAATGLLGWWFTASVLLAAGAAVLALLLVGLGGFGARGGGLGGMPITWGGRGGGGFGGGGGGGFRSGGGGNFGGGGASGRW